MSSMRSLEWLGGKEVTSNCRSSRPAHGRNLFDVSSRATTEDMLRDLAHDVGTPKSRAGFSQTTAREPRRPAVSTVKSKDEVIRWAVFVY